MLSNAMAAQLCSILKMLMDSGDDTIYSVHYGVLTRESITAYFLKCGE